MREKWGDDGSVPLDLMREIRKRGGSSVDLSKAQLEVLYVGW